MTLFAVVVVVVLAVVVVVAAAKEKSLVIKPLVPLVFRGPVMEKRMINYQAKYASGSTNRGKPNIMLLLTNGEVHTGKYSDRSLDVRTERSEVRTKN